MFKFNRRFVVATALAGAIGLGWPVSADAQTIKLDMHESFGPTNISSIAAADFARLVKEKTGGKVDVAIHYSGSLGIGERDLLNAVEEGVVPLSSTILDKLLGTLPIAGIQFVPFTADNLDDATALFNVLRPYIQEDLAKQNQVLLFETIGVPVGLWSKKPVTSVSDLKTLKMRTNNPATTKTFQNAGGKPTFMAWADVPAALGTGIIDSVVTTGESGLVARLYEQLPHYSALNMEIGFWLVHMHKPTLDKLPPDLKAAILAAGEEAGKNAYARVRPRLEENSKTMKEKGVTVTEDVPAELQQHLAKSSSELRDDWRKKVGPEKADKILAAYEQTRKKTN